MSDEKVDRTHEYEKLEGGEGRAVHFRPQRFRPMDLAPIEVAAQIFVDGRSVDVEVANVSQNGASLVLPEDLSFVEGDVTRLTLRTDGHDAYSGEVRVQWMRSSEPPLVGVAFVDSLLDLEEVLQLRNMQTTRRQSVRPSQRGWRVVRHDRFKASVGEFALFLGDVSENLAEMERSFSPQLVYATVDSAPRRALERVIQEDVTPGVVHYSNELDAALRLSTPSEHQALQEFSHRYLHKLLVQAPWIHRAYHKPLGYPGDFEVMNFVYARDLVGPNLFARALHRAFLEVPAAEAVRARKDLTKAQLIGKLKSPTRSDGSVRILSIAAGPAQELYELLEEAETLPPTEILLFDQDAGALTHAHRRLNAVVAARWKDRVRVTYLHDSIKRLLVDPEIFSTRGTFDAILCAGFFDYLRPHSATRTAKTFHRYLAPGGSAYIGNMVPENPSRWLMEHHLDWYLIYRSREEMLAFGKAAAPGAELSILEERTGVNPFLSIRRPL